MPFLTSNGIRLHYQEMGHGHTLVMLHGLLLDSLALWYFTASRIASNQRRILTYDFRGHGKSEKTVSGFDLHTLSLDLAGLLDGLEPRLAIDLCGYSYGCLVALRYAIDNPTRVRKLVLVEAPMPPARHFDWGQWLQADTTSLINALPTTLRGAVLSSPGRALKLAERINYLVKQTSLLDAIRTEPKIAESDLASISSPTLCIYGDQSEFLNDGFLLKRVMFNATLKILEGSHRLMNECAPAVTVLVEDFLNG